MSTRCFDVGKSYSRYPAGRFSEDGPFSGQRFREEVLLPALRQGSTIEVVLDNTAGYGSSFLEEAFGGLVRAGIGADAIFKLLILTTEDDGLRDEILSYIDDELARRRGRGK